MTSTLKLYDPTGVPLPAGGEVRQTLVALAGKVVGFIDNSKPNFSHLADDLAALLTQGSRRCARAAASQARGVGAGRRRRARRLRPSMRPGDRRLG